MLDDVWRDIFHVHEQHFSLVLSMEQEEQLPVSFHLPKKEIVQAWNC